MTRIDKISKIDVTSRLSRVQARKFLSEIFSADPSLISFSRHGLDQIRLRRMTTIDVINVLKQGHIKLDPEFENGSWRYRVETNNMLVVIAFRKPNHLTVITAWRK